MSNMKIWDTLKQPPPDALKTIRGGRMSGKTDINPQWRIQAMTELFGPIGFGWKYKMTDHWTEPGDGGQVVQFVTIDLYIKCDGEWSEPIPGVGGNMLIVNEKNGPYTNDEAMKMATTDALSVAMKLLGVAADIYAGKWDGSKYSTSSSDPSGNNKPQTNTNDLI